MQMLTKALPSDKQDFPLSMLRSERHRSSDPRCCGGVISVRSVHHVQSSALLPVSSNIETAMSEIRTQPIMYHAGAILLPVARISQPARSCAVPPNTETAMAYALDMYPARRCFGKFSGISA